jgi:tRNA modification GTPase
MAEADVVLLVLDATTPFHQEDEATIASLTTRPLLIAINKHDLAPSISLANQAIHKTVATSALTGAGISELRQAILSQITVIPPHAETALLTNLRQQQAVSTALVALTHAQRAILTTTPHEMLLLDLYESLHALDTLTGTTTSDDILHLIFSKFCIGK